MLIHKTIEFVLFVMTNNNSWNWEPDVSNHIVHVFDSSLFVLTASTQKSIDNFHEISRRSQSLISNCLFCSLFHRAELSKWRKTKKANCLMIFRDWLACRWDCCWLLLLLLLLFNIFVSNFAYCVERFDSSNDSNSDDEKSEENWPHPVTASVGTHKTLTQSKNNKPHSNGTRLRCVAMLLLLTIFPSCVCFSMHNN